MTLLPAMMVTITLTMLVLMVPKMYFSWIMAERLTEEGEADRLKALLAEANVWIKRHFGCGVVGLGIVWFMMNRQTSEIPSTLTDSVAFYVTVALVLSIVESYLAQKISNRLDAIPVAVRVREK